MENRKMALLAECQVSFVIRHNSVGRNGYLCVWLTNSFCLYIAKHALDLEICY